MQPRASDISTNPPSLSPVTRVAHKKNTFPRAWMFSFPHYWEVSNLFLDTPEPFSWSSAHRSQLARSALPTAINSSLPMEPFPSAFPGHSACPQCGWSLQTLTAPRLSPKKGHILYSGAASKSWCLAWLSISQVLLSRALGQAQLLDPLGWLSATLLAQLIC